MNSIDFSNSIKCEDKIQLISNHFDQLMALYGIIGVCKYNELSVESSNEDYVSFIINTDDILKLFSLITKTPVIHIYNTSFIVHCSYIDNTSLLVGINKINKDISL